MPTNEEMLKLLQSAMVDIAAITLFNNAGVVGDGSHMSQQEYTIHLKSLAVALEKIRG